MINMVEFYFKMNKELLAQSLYNLFNFDCDWNGENGDEYLKEEAREMGFETNLEWFIGEHINSFLNDEGIFTQTADEFRDSLNALCSEYVRHNYYSVLEANVLELESGCSTVASLVYIFET